MRSFENQGSGAACTGIECSVDCAGQLLPLLERCRFMVDLLFDGLDGVEDGVAVIFDKAYDTCLAIDAPEAMAALAQLQAQGQCTGDELNGVAEVPVGEAPCEDRRDGCAHLIASGFMTCASDFSPTGTNAGECDRTCAFCEGPSGPPPPCSDLRDQCSETIATGFVTCENDFCPTCPMKEQCGACPFVFPFSVRESIFI